MTGDPPPMIRVAFASNDYSRVNLHFGAAESFVVYDIVPGEADLVGVGRFRKAEMKGENKDKGNPRETIVLADRPVAGRVPVPQAAVQDIDLVPEDKVIAKLDFLDGCAAVYAASIGSSSIKRLMIRKIQPIIVDNGHDIQDLLNEVSLALRYGGLSWVDRAKARALGPLDAAAREARLGGEKRRLIASVEELEDSP